MQRVLCLGDAHTHQLRSAARAACSQGGGLLNICSLALIWGGRAVDIPAHTKQSRYKSRHRGATPLTSAIQNGGSVAHQRKEGHLQKIQFTPVSVTESDPCIGSLYFLLALEGATRITTILYYVEDCSLEAGGGGTATLPPPPTAPSPKVRCFTLWHLCLFYGLMLWNTVQASSSSKMLRYAECGI